MEHEPAKMIAKWWLKLVAAVLGVSLPGSALFLRSTLESQLASASPALLANGLIVLLSLIGALIAWAILQRPWLSWDIPTGTWVNRFNGVRYCGTCKANKKIAVPLKNEKTGWRCVACDTFRTDPARVQKKKSSLPTGINKGLGRKEWIIR